MPRHSQGAEKFTCDNACKRRQMPCLRGLPMVISCNDRRIAIIRFFNHNILKKEKQSCQVEIEQDRWVWDQ